MAARARGAKASLPEYSGGPVADISIGVEGCLNVLRYRGQLGGALTGPGRLPTLERFRTFHPSCGGILQGRYGPADVGKPIPAGLVGWVASAVDGRHLEEFHLEEEGAILLLATTSPAVTLPGNLGYIVGFPDGEIDVPQL